MSGLADIPEYTHEVYWTGHAILKLAAGPVEVFGTICPDVFATDRRITQAEYEEIRSAFRALADNAAMASSPKGLAEFASRHRP